MKHSLLRLIAAVALALGSTPASAAVVLDFEGIGPYPNNSSIFIQDFYNGGTSSAGTSGSNYGVSVSSNSQLVCLNTLSEFCSGSSRGGLGDSTSQQGGLFFRSGNSAILTVAAGFNTGVSFFYAVIHDRTSFVTVWDGPDGTGNQLAAAPLATVTAGCANALFFAQFCPFASGDVAFAGTARSIEFFGPADQIVIDDVTFASITPGIISEPGSLALLATSFAAASILRRRARTAGWVS